MKETLLDAKKTLFLTIDFYLQCFFFGLLIVFGVLSLTSGYFMILGLFSLLPIALYNSIGMTYHIFRGSYSTKVEIFRKIHAISAIIYLAIFVLVTFILEYPANKNELTFIIFWGIPPLFLIAYFFITLKDWKAMKQLNS
ncbi:hypothetical protein WAF17_05600 [Bernardetia sp. ABR2-2B]|uniref:hypothetical protein n=1 Tax=Bernardetia sp. ABR2-2B TaxID=3127472 RepID=UPI0030D0D5BF